MKYIERKILDTLSAHRLGRTLKSIRVIMCSLDKSFRPQDVWTAIQSLHDEGYINIYESNFFISHKGLNYLTVDEILDTILDDI